MKGCGGTETAKRGIFGTGREGGKGMRLIFVGADHEVTGITCRWVTSTFWWIAAWSRG